MRAKRILISAYIGSANVGDEAIISSIISQIRSKIEPVKITVFSLNPSHTSSSFGVRVFSSWSILRVVYEIFKTDVYICGGGGIVQDETSIFSLPLVLWKPYLASLLNKKVMFYAIGIGPLKNNFGKILTRFVLEKSSKISVRDTDSKKLLISVGIKNSKIIIAADSAINLKPCGCQDTCQIMEIEKIPTDKKLIAVCLRYWFYKGKGIPNSIFERRAFAKGKHLESYYNFIRETAKTLDSIIESYDVNFLFIPFYYGRDVKIHNDIIDNLVHQERVYRILRRYKASEILGIISNVHFVIGMRLHSLIFATIAKVPMIAIKYSEKIESFMKLIDLSQYQLELEYFTAETFFQKFRMTWKDYENIKGRMEDCIKPLRTLEYLNMSNLLTLIR